MEKIKKALIVDVGDTNPYHNLALEEYMFNALGNGETVLYLWQNDNTIVIGQNQNAYSQYNITLAKELNVNIARRKSGGGAVYHDLGNLNYTFLNENVSEFSEINRNIILNALLENKIDAYISGRNDIEVDGRKISGTAYYSDEKKICHHGTLLIDSNIEIMNRVLQVDSRKWENKGVDSVRNRVLNLKEKNLRLNIAGMKKSLKKSFSKSFPQAEIKEYNNIDDIIGEDKNQYEKLVEKYSSEQWIFGRAIQANFRLKEKFSWGLAEILCKIEGDIIVETQIHSDSLETDLISQISGALCEIKFNPDDIQSCLANFKAELSEPVKIQITDDICDAIIKEIK